MNERGQAKSTASLPGRFWLRPANTEDAPTLLALIQAAYAEYRGRLDPPSGAFEESAAHLAHLLSTEEGVLAGAGATAVGCVFYRRDGIDTYFHRLAVLPAWRQVAFGRALVSYVEARAREAGSRLVRLGVRLQLPANQAYYTALGYQVERYDSHRGYQEPTFALMVKAVAEPDERIVAVVPPDPDWPRQFEGEARLLRLVFGAELVAIHHIGSTSVPGLYAKPVIDMMPIVRAIGAVDSFNPVMRALGYTPRGEWGIPGRRYFHRGEHLRTHQVHVFAADSPEVARHLHFRDYLVAHPAQARRYGDLKQAVAARFPHDIHGYMAGKDALIKELEAEAAAWQAGTAGSASA